MIYKSYILKNLKEIDNLYKKSNSTRKGLFYSKLAILELCGWIEESMDNIIRLCTNHHIKNIVNFEFVEKNIIKRTSGFEYDRHFRIMLIKLLGIINVEKLENRLDTLKFDQLKSSLTSLKESRDREAHTYTHLKGITKTRDAPSVIISYFFPVYNGLKDIDNKLRYIKL